MESPASPRRRRISARTKLAFSSGSLEQAMVGAAGVATMIYYNQVLGVSPALCGTAFLIASIVDAVSDPLVGALSDSVRTRWGRRHPFMFLSAFPLAVCFYLNVPAAGRAVRSRRCSSGFTATMIGVRLAKTFYAVPHSALGAELTDDYDERTSVWGWNWIRGGRGRGRARRLRHVRRLPLDARLRQRTAGSGPLPVPGAVRRGVLLRRHHVLPRSRRRTRSPSCTASSPWHSARAATTGAFSATRSRTCGPWS